MDISRSSFPSALMSFASIFQYQLSSSDVVSMRRFWICIQDQHQKMWSYVLEWQRSKWIGTGQAYIVYNLFRNGRQRPSESPMIYIICWHNELSASPNSLGVYSMLHHFSHCLDRTFHCRMSSFKMHLIGTYIGIIIPQPVRVCGPVSI